MSSSVMPPRLLRRRISISKSSRFFLGFGGGDGDDELLDAARTTPTRSQLILLTDIRTKEVHVKTYRDQCDDDG